MPTTWIEDKLTSHEVFTPHDIEAILTQFTGILDAKRETQVLDFKEKFEISSTEGKCGLAKSITEFCNSTGGVLVFGVNDSCERIGVARDSIIRMDPADVQQALEKYCAASEISLNVVPCEAYDLMFAALIVYPAPKPIVMHADGEYEVATKKKWDFRRGQILVRYGAKGDIARQKDIDRIINRLALEQSRRLVKRFETIAMLSPDLELAAYDPKTGAAARLIGSDKAIPIQVITDAPATALPVGEVFTDDPFKTLEQSVMAQVRTYNTDSMHRVSSKLVGKWFLQRAEVSQIGLAAELGLLSCLRDRGFPGFWAALLPRETLRSLIVQCCGRLEYPDVTVLPYLIGAFFWSQRSELLDPLIRQRSYPQTSRLASKVKRLDWQEFILNSRLSSRQTIPSPTEGLIGIRTLELDREKCLEVFEHYVEQFVSGELRDKNAAAQLDLILFAERQHGQE